MFRLQALQDNYNTAPQEASNFTKSTTYHKVSAYQHFQNAAESLDASETSSIASQQLMIDKDRGSTTATSSQNIPSLLSFEAESDAELTSASIDVVAQLCIHKSPALQEGCIFEISETPVRHCDIQSHPPLMLSDAHDAWAVPTDKNNDSTSSARQHSTINLQDQNVMLAPCVHTSEVNDGTDSTRL